MVEERGVHRVLVGKPEGKRLLGRPRRRWEDNIKMDVQKVGGGRGDWMELAQGRDRWRALVGTAAIQERATAVLRSIPKEVFAGSFQKLYERCQPCVVKDDDYFEGQ
jgi:hypothetical protein